MSKKKAAQTMRLKDFHGGSIPSDLPLPSAPGLSAWPTQSTLAALPSRSRHPNPSHTSPLPAPPRMIGRHFDEDERTPFDAPPQRPVVIPSGAWAAKSNPATSHPNPTPTVWSPTKLAQASAVEKVISGRWHTNSSNSNSNSNPNSSKSESQASPVRSDVKVSEPMKYNSKAEVWAPPVSSNLNISEPIEEINPLIRAHGSGFERPVARSGVIGENRVLKSPIKQEIKAGEVRERLEDFHPFGNSKKQGYFGNNWESNERPKSVGSRSAVDFEGKEIGRPVSHEGRFGEVRPKLKLLPRSKMVSGEGKTVILEEKNGDSEEGIERPRLNLKPRSKVGGGMEDENKRQSVFGGARPRELVLKDRGVDHVSQEPEKVLPSSRPNSGSLEPTQFKPTDKHLEISNLQRNPRNPNPNPNQRTNWKAPHQQRPEPDTWRKPEPPAKQEMPRVAKGASALELAQAFSKPGNQNPVLRNENPALFSRLLGGERNNRAPHQQINGY